MLNLIDLECFREARGGGVFEVFSKILVVRIHRDCLILWSFDVFHYDLRGDSLQMEVCGNAGCLF